MIRGSGDLLMAEQRVSMREHLMECLRRDYAAREPYLTPEEFAASQRELEQRCADITAAAQADRDDIAIYRAIHSTSLPDQLKDARHDQLPAFRRESHQRSGSPVLC